MSEREAHRTGKMFLWLSSVPQDWLCDRLLCALSYPKLRISVNSVCPSLGALG